MTAKPNVLVLGGCGFVGRHLVDHLVSNDLAAYIRVVDKTPPQMAWMNRRHTDLFTSKPNVHFVSANLIDEASCERAFSSTGCQTDDAQTAPVPFPAATAPSWDIVINCAAETRPGRTDAVHADGTVRLSMNCARQSRAHRVRRYVELSSGNMHGSVQPGKRPADERAPIDPWTAEARHKSTVERRLHAGDDGALEGLAYTVVRLPLVYGTGDRRGLAHRITIAAIYKYLGDTMKLLWTSGLRLNTVHVSDAAAAIWHLANHPPAAGQVYNVVDDAQSTQGTLSELLATIYGIRVDYWGTFLSMVTKVNIFEALDEINDKHMGPWAELCENNEIANTPLTPFMEEELLENKHLHLDNAKLKATGFQLAHPLVTRELLEEIIGDFAEMKLMPSMVGAVA